MIVKNPFTAKGNVRTGVIVSGKTLKKMKATPGGITPQPIYKSVGLAWTVNDIPSPVWRLIHKGIKLEKIAQIVGKSVSTMKNVRAQTVGYHLSESDLAELKEFENGIGK